MGVNMHPELERLERDFAWRPDFSPDLLVPMWLRKKSLTVSNSAYSDTHTLNRAELDQRSWWYQTRNSIILNVLNDLDPKGAVWDIGSGTGVVTRRLAQSGKPVIAVEPSAAGSRITAAQQIPTFESELTDLSLPSDSISTLTLLDVLEHIPERHVLLDEIHRVLCPTGVLIITVPALPILWSQFDIDEKHQLRYTSCSLKRDLAKCGFEVKRSWYFFILSVVPLLILRAVPFRLGLRRSLSDKSAVSVSGGIFGRVAAWLEQRVALLTPFGSSLLVVAGKAPRTSH